MDLSLIFGLKIFSEIPALFFSCQSLLFFVNKTFSVTGIRTSGGYNENYLASGALFFSRAVAFRFFVQPLVVSTQEINDDKFVKKDFLSLISTKNFPPFYSLKYTKVINIENKD